jgi:hypothetical protein
VAISTPTATIAKTVHLLGRSFNGSAVRYPHPALASTRGLRFLGKGPVVIDPQRT